MRDKQKIQIFTIKKIDTKDLINQGRKVTHKRLQTRSILGSFFGSLSETIDLNFFVNDRKYINLFGQTARKKIEGF